MKTLDRLLIDWSKGNFTGSFGLFMFAKDKVFFRGNPVCARYKDMADDPFLLFRNDYALGNVENPVVPERHFKGRKWYSVAAGHFEVIPQRLKFVRAIEARARRGGWRSLSHSEIYEVGVALRELREVVATLGMNVFVTDLENNGDVEGDFVMGARHLLGGRLGAVTLKKDEWNHYSLSSFTIHEDFGNALLLKLKDDNIALHDLEEAA
jgi:hypothetical protein